MSLREKLFDKFIDILMYVFLPMLTILVICTLSWWVMLSMQANSTCLAHGYPSSTSGWYLKFYCVKRVNQTDIVVPIEDLP